LSIVSPKFPSLVFLKGILLLAAVSFLAEPSPLFAKEPFTGYFSPLLSEDGNKVFYVMRRTSGRTWGFGWENLTPPARVKVSADQFSLHRFDLRTGEDETLKVWPESPLAGRKYRAYRGSRYAIPFVHLRLRGEAGLEYEIAFSVPSSKGRTAWRLHGTWSGGGDTPGDQPEGSDVWKKEGYRMTGIVEESLRGSLEVLVVPGPASFPAAVVMVDHRDGSWRTLLRTSRFEEEYPEGIPGRIISERSQKEEIERLRALRKAHRDTLKKFMDAGLSEGDALLRTGREMERLGFYPKRPTITARLLGPEEKRSAGDDVPIFDISEREFTVGLFRDIREAIENPGVEADKSMGLYVRHRDFTTSELLNAYLKGEGRVFHVRHRGSLYELTIQVGDSR
jgi:hypothetical protein